METIKLTDLTVLAKVWYKSSLETCNSNKALSTLLITTNGLILSPKSCLKTVLVWTKIPSTVSTTTKAPSVTLKATVTSEEKST